MRELIEQIRTNLYIAGEFTELVLNILSLVFIVMGTVISISRSLRNARKTRPNTFHMPFRLMFGGWLVVALEFQLAADIVGTIVAPSPQNLIELGAVALIRTFLNYFLNKELNEGMKISTNVKEEHLA